MSRKNTQPSARRKSSTMPPPSRKRSKVAPLPNTPIKYRPAAEPVRTPLEPIEGPLAPRPVVVTWNDTEKSDDGEKRPRFGPEQIAREREVLTQNYDRDSLGSLFGRACGVEASPSTPGFLLEMLTYVRAELETIECAVRPLDDGGGDIAKTIYRLGERIEVAIEARQRAASAAVSADSSSAWIVVLPPAREVAAALLLLPGVLSGSPSTWERLQRIAERCGFVVRLPGDGDPKIERDVAWFAKENVDRARRGLPVIDPMPSVATEKDPTIRLFERNEHELARMLTLSVGLREDYFQVAKLNDSDRAWARDVAAHLVGDETATGEAAA